MVGTDEVVPAPRALEDDISGNEVYYYDDTGVPVVEPTTALGAAIHKVSTKRRVVGFSVNGPTVEGHQTGLGVDR